MRKMLGILMAGVMAMAPVTAAFASCHGGGARSYQEYERFKGLVPAKVLAESKDIVAAVDDFFVTKYPKGQLLVDPSQLTEEQIAAQQVDVTVDYIWLQKQLVTLRERARAAGASDEAIGWLAYAELPIVYGPELGQRILTEDLPKLASFSADEAYPRAKYDAILAACATSLEKAEVLHTVDSIGGVGFFTKCGTLQPADKRVDGHMQLTHAIYDNVMALKAYERDHRKWWQL
ncbi:MAG: hypothetical protein EON60_01585 [Alphaproteobacteria bacterium]|nr:MAG: hypothetical protein EON60_01585 [Alphaproteobacteria bacterium]